jgi:Nucleotidyl transferase of unknown function (DUF2204)
MSESNADSLREALKRVATTLKAGGQPFALAGSYAMWAHGAPESEHDVDFVVSEEDADRVAHTLQHAGLEVVRPPEDWLLKVRVGGVVVDLLHQLGGVPVSSELLERATTFEVLSVAMPVLDTTDVLIGKLRALDEHYCDFGALLPSMRAVREQIDWPRLREEVADNDFAVAFLVLTDRLAITEPIAAPASSSG